MSDAPNKPAVHITRVLEEDGRLVRAPVTSEICDFCGDRNPAWDYDCADFVIDDLKFASTGGWAACEECSSAIEAGAWNLVVDRATFGMEPNYVTAAYRHGLPRMHAGFRQHRIGDRVRHQED